MIEYIYPDLIDPQYVYDSLVGYGLFPDKLPKCFTSKDILEIDYETLIKEVEKPYRTNNKNHYPTSYIEYSSIRHTNVPRIMAIPHPKNHINLCEVIRRNWGEINANSNQIENKISFCHIRKYKHSQSIFYMNYDNGDKNISRKLELEYAIEASYQVKADIATCFPSMYSHSISWAINGKNKTKNNFSSNQRCMEWHEKLDQAIRNTKEGETNGLLIGPHTSNILSEIILNAIDNKMRKKYTKIIRFIDDYTYYAESHDKAQSFIRDLTKELKIFDLRLNDKKTSIKKLPANIDPQWKLELNLFQFRVHGKYKTTQIGSILNFIDYSLNIHEKFNRDSVILNYAIKIISSHKIYKKHLCILLDRLFHLILQYPYLVTLLENEIFIKHGVGVDELNQSNFHTFIKCLLGCGVGTIMTEPVSYAIYFAIKYQLTFDSQNDISNVIELKDCISNVLLFHYAKNNKDTKLKSKIIKFIESITEKRDKDRYWLLGFEVLDGKKLQDFDEFLYFLKSKNVKFVQFV